MNEEIFKIAYQQVTGECVSYAHALKKAQDPELGKKVMAVYRFGINCYFKGANEIANVFTKKAADVKSGLSMQQELIKGLNEK